jgi:DNA-binding transcriptional MocR family regulator
VAVLSARVRDLRASPVRAMLEASQRPEVISFAGGLPAPESFADIDLAMPPASLLQYGPSEGEPALRKKIAEELSVLGLDCPPERVLVLSGSQQGIDLAAKLFVDPGVTVATQSPAYLAALQVFRFFGARFAPIDIADPAGGWQGGETPALAYVTPTFQNPTGVCLTLAEREALAAACDATGVTLFEDDPYRDLVYDPCERRPVASLVRRASWIYQGSFSKTVAPGLRLGFLTASEDLFPHLVLAKQAADLHANRLSQWLVLRHLEDPGRAARMDRLVAAYRGKRDAFAAAMQQRLGNLAEWRTPPGGLFFWARLAPGVDTGALLERAIARNVLFAPGDHFLAAPGSDRPAMRLNFSHADPEAAERGLAVLAELIAEAQPAAPSAISRSISSVA